MEQFVELADDVEAVRIFGIHDRNLKLVRDHFGISVNARGHIISLEGEEQAVHQAMALFEKMVESVRGGGAPPDGLVDEAVLSEPPSEHEKSRKVLDFAAIARTPGQKEYLEAIASHDIVVCTGPAGTGKTYLAVRMAVEALKSGTVKKLVLCRPAVEAGEKLGFLPGDFQAKVNPYLRPLYDALHELLEYDQIRRYSDREIIEVVPLAYMRGRTLNRSFIILDEGQNTSPVQMKMFLTRMGQESRIVATGDVTQVDLPRGQPSGLLHARRVLGEIPGIAWLELTRRDIVRNSLVTKIVSAYERHEGQDQGSKSQLPKGSTR
ncbi:MAG: PhoH family protein [Planctomycetota bacterium]